MPKLFERGLQYNFGGEFGENSQIDDFTRKVLGLLPGLERYKPLAIVTSLEIGSSKNIVSNLMVRAGGEERSAVVLSGLKSFQEYCQGNKVRGMIILIPSFGFDGISPPAQRALRDFFVGIGKVKNPDNYRVWFVDKSAADLPAEPKGEISRKRLTDKKEAIREMGLCEVEYRHPFGQKISWFTARPEKKTTIGEKDVRDDERIRFLQKWMKTVVEYRGGRIVSEEELKKELMASKSILISMQKVADSRGVSSEESCGCLVYTNLNGGIEDILKCDGEGCFRDRKSRDPKSAFRLGSEYKMTACGDCGGERTAKAYWADIDSFNLERGVRVNYEIICKDFAGHSKKDAVWVDPARILNPMYIYYCLHRKKDKGEIKNGKN